MVFNILCTLVWKTCGVFSNPNDITNHSRRPFELLKVVHEIDFSWSCICQKLLLQSNL